jgi:MYXO-CTERM domain-containing protein
VAPVDSGTHDAATTGDSAARRDATAQNDAESDAESDAASGAPEAPSEDTGCSCRVMPHQSDTSALATSLVVGAVVLLRLRRRRQSA